MNYCSIEDIGNSQLKHPENTHNVFSSDGRQFTAYRQSNYYLELLAKQFKLNINSNEFRLFLQKNPDKLQKLIANDNN
jgi:hypothetical protein